MKIFFSGISLLIIASVSFYLWGSSEKLNSDELMWQKSYQNSPSPSIIDPYKQTFTVVSYNIGYLSGMTNNQAVERSESLYQGNLQRTIDYFKKIQPDFVGFQEIDLDANRSYNVNQAQELLQKVPFAESAVAVNWHKNYVPFPYWPPNLQFGPVVSGQAILSRYPIRKHEKLVLSRPLEAPFYYNAFYLDRLAELAIVDVGGVEVVIVNVHLEAYESSTRLLQAQQLVDFVKPYVDKYPVLLIGDFNSVVPELGDQFPHYEEGGEAVDDTVPIIQRGLNLNMGFRAGKDFSIKALATYPADNARYKIDYIFYNSHKIKAIDSFVAREIGDPSDHLPVVMKFQLL